MCYLFLNKEINMTIKYHYTNLNGLFNILKNQTLRFGNVNMMNDSNELEIGKDLLVSYLCKRYSTNHFDKHTLESLFVSSKIFDAFIFCMSSEAEDLNQWRVYADNGNGVQIAINTENLNKYVQFHLENSMGRECKETLRIPYQSDGTQKCEYVKNPNVHIKDANKELFNKLDIIWQENGFDDYFDLHDGILVTKNIKHQITNKTLDVPNDIQMRSMACFFGLEKILTRLYATTKKTSYQVENEYRNVIYADRSLLITSDNFNPDGVCIKDIFDFYLNRYGISSCIDIPISYKRDFGGIIEDIKLGCNANKTNAVAIKDLLKHKWGSLNIPISYSDITFR